MTAPAYIDLSALEALICRDHPAHASARECLESIVVRNIALISSRHTLYALADRLRNNAPTNDSRHIINALLKSRLIRFETLTPDDEHEAWRLYFEMNASWWNFYHCAALALMNRLQIEHVFCFDQQYARYGFSTIPEDSQ